MDGIAVQTTENQINVIFDKNLYNEKEIKNWLESLEFEKLSRKVNFSDEILEIGKEIKSSIWQKEKQRLGYE